MADHINNADLHTNEGKAAAIKAISEHWGEEYGLSKKASQVVFSNPAALWLESSIIMASAIHLEQKQQLPANPYWQQAHVLLERFYLVYSKQLQKVKKPPICQTEIHKESH